jgi:hypothetical protein
MRRAFLISLVLCFVSTVSLFATVPQQINYQGYLTNTGGSPLDTTVAMTFKLYTDSTGATLLWTETRPSVTVTKGLFNVRLGQVTALGDNVFNHTQVWLGITVGSNSEMTPRSRVVSVGYSYRVGTVDGASGGSISGKINVGSGNTNTGNYANVLGESNAASGDHAAIGGGSSNSAADSFSTVTGGQNNQAQGKYSVVAGGGGHDWAEGNAVYGEHSVIGGGYNNRVWGDGVVVGGGSSNWGLSGASYGVIGGGFDNSVSNNCTYATIGGGMLNDVLGNYSTIGGGSINSTFGVNSTIGGGEHNQARGSYSTVSGGGGSTVSDSNSALGDYSTVGGGHGNFASGGSATVSGGAYNLATGGSATVGGGYDVKATAPGATAAGGSHAYARGTCATVGGGGGLSAADSNSAIGDYSVVPGGRGNRASGSYSFAAGRRARAGLDGQFVWSDATDADMTYNLANSFVARSTGGVRFFTNSALTAGVYLESGSNAWMSVSDSTKKRNLRLVDTKLILDRVSQLPIKQWSYKSQDPSIEHIGPMAQDFWKQFHIGDDSLSISTIDPDGIALAAIQELNKKVQEIEILKAQNLALERQMAEIRLQLQQLANQGIISREQTSLTNSSQ